MKKPENERAPITWKELDDWACGQATPEVEAAIRVALKDPNSEPSRYCDWLRNPAKYKREHDRLPELVVQQLASISPETWKAMSTLGGPDYPNPAGGRKKRSSKEPAAPSGNDYEPEQEHEQGPYRFIRDDKSQGPGGRSR